MAEKPNFMDESGWTYYLVLGEGRGLLVLGSLLVVLFLELASLRLVFLLSTARTRGC